MLLTSKPKRLGLSTHFLPVLFIAQQNKLSLMPKPARRRKACPLFMLAISLAFHLLIGSREHRTCNRRIRSVKAQKLWPAIVQSQIRHDETLLHLKQSFASPSCAENGLRCANQGSSLTMPSKLLRYFAGRLVDPRHKRGQMITWFC